MLTERRARCLIDLITTLTDDWMHVRDSLFIEHDWEAKDYADACKGLAEIAGLSPPVCLKDFE